MPDAIARQMLRPFRGNDIRSALRTLIDSYSSHRRFLHLCFLKLSARQGNAVTSGQVWENAVDKIRFCGSRIRSVELIVHPEAKGGVGEMRVSGPPASPVGT